MTIRIPVGQPLIWNEEAIAALGKQSDLSLAQVLKIDHRTVAKKRRELGIEPWHRPKQVLVIICEVDGRRTEVRGRRASRLRRTCPNPHPVTHPGPSDCEKALRSATMKLTQPPHRRLVKNLGSSRSVIRLLDDD